ncbi:MAG: SulP family inorganic anion transporter [Actinobacteria bacterium]|nr:SulP family inorganic anion transporter [Actinomycetota bacterium]
MNRSGWARWVPGVAAARGYRRGDLRHDLVAGLVLSALLVPQGMAYAELAGLPPVTGLYTTVLGLLAYALFGPSKTLVVGPDSSLGPMIAAAILPLVGAGGDPAQAIALAGMLALLMGVICILAGVARIGALAELLSMPVRVGYLNGIALVIVVSQLPKLFGFSVDATSTVGELREFVDAVADGATNATALLLGLLSFAVIVAFRRFLPKVPGVLVAVVGATATVSLLDLAGEVPVVGTVPQGFPELTFPTVSFEDAVALAVAALGIAFVTLADTTVLARTFAAKVGDVSDPNQDMVGLGAANVAAGLFQGFPVSASSSRTAVAFSSGARTQLVGVVGAAVVLAVLLSASDLLSDLPSATLAAVVLAAALMLFDLPVLSRLWRVRRSELVLSMAALVGVVVFGVLEGIVVAIALSLANFVRRVWRPYDAELGRLVGRKGYHDVRRHPDADLIPGLVLYRWDAPVFFANADEFSRRIRESVANQPEAVRWVVVAAEPITDVDTTGAEVLEELVGDLESEGRVLAFAELKGPVKDRLRVYGLYDKIGDEHFLPTLGTAIDAYLRATGVEWDDPIDGSGGPASPAR